MNGDSVADELFYQGLRFYSGLELDGKASHEHDEKRAVGLWHEGALFGHAKCHLWLGQAYVRGRGTERDYVKAVKHYRTAALAGNLDAMSSLASLYSQGRGVTMDKTEAVRWFAMAAARNHPSSQFSLGVAYSFGDGVARDDIKSTLWYGRAANNGDAFAQLRYAEALEEGRGIGRNYQEAYTWYMKASASAILPAIFGVIRLLLSNRIMPNDKTAFALLKREADEKKENGGNISCQCWLAYCYANGRGVERNVAEALRLYDLATKRGRSIECVYVHMWMCVSSCNKYGA